MLTNQHVEVEHKLVDMSTSSVESLLAGAMRRLLLAGARFMRAFGIRPFAVVRFCRAPSALRGGA